MFSKISGWISIQFSKWIKKIISPKFSIKAWTNYKIETNTSWTRMYQRDRRRRRIQTIQLKVLNVHIILLIGSRKHYLVCHIHRDRANHGLSIWYVTTLCEHYNTAIYRYTTNSHSFIHLRYWHIWDELKC